MAQRLLGRAAAAALLVAFAAAAVQQPMTEPFKTDDSPISPHAAVEKVHVVWMNHLDVGFTNSISSVMNDYFHRATRAPSILVSFLFTLGF